MQISYSAENNHGFDCRLAIAMGTEMFFSSLLPIQSRYQLKTERGNEESALTDTVCICSRKIDHHKYRRVPLCISVVTTIRCKVEQRCRVKNGIGADSDFDDNIADVLRDLTGTSRCYT